MGERAALIWGLVSGFEFILTCLTAYAIFHSISILSSHRTYARNAISIMEEDMNSQVWTRAQDDRRHFIGGSDARIIMGDDEAALLHLWREKRGEAEHPRTCPPTSSSSSAW